MRCIVEGFGSIGARHAALLKELGHEVACVTKRDDVPYPVYRNAAEAILNFKPDFYLVATPTALHHDSLKRLEELGYKGRVLVEKPVTNFLEQCKNIPSFETYIAYNLRFHPIVEKMRKELGDEPVVAARLSVGQYLPDWRPGRDYRESYSAIKSQGGGVLRDLSHELDLARYFFGPFKRVAANIGKFSELEIDSEDWVDALIVAEKCPAISIHLDYLDRNPHRHFVIISNTRTLSADLWHNSLCINGECENFVYERNDSFRKQLNNILSDQKAALCSWTDAQDVMKLIEAIEKSAQTNCWEQII